ncbi:MAG: 3-hydroxyacyl-CoA dehydrogenase family protein [Chitinophagaceae bacterium]
MKLAVITNERLKSAFLSKPLSEKTRVVFVESPQQVPADAVVIDLLFDCSQDRIEQLKQFLPLPVFVNAVTHTLRYIGQPFVRVNAWPGFLNNPFVEVVAPPAQEAMVKNVFDALGWQYQLVPDITGMISARIISTIINEAYYTLADKISSKEDIDIAMKLGTHYPYGPFEWSKRIGLKNIHELLIQLGKEDNLYQVADLLTTEMIAENAH